MIIASTHYNIFLFSDKGKVFVLKAYEIPVASKTSRGKSLKGIINLASNENITEICGIPGFEEELYLCMVTRNGIVKKIGVNEFVNARKGGIIALNLKKEDELVDVKLVGRDDDVVIATKMGFILRTNLKSMRAMGRNAAGIIGIKLRKDDCVIGMALVSKQSELLVLTDRGYGKRVPFKNFATKGRGGKGMIYLKVTPKNGAAAGIRTVFPEDEVIITSKNGMTIRVKAKGISLQGRSTIGVKLLDLNQEDVVSDFAVISDED